MANFFDKFLNKALTKANESVLGIDIGASSIKVVQIKRKGGRAVLQTYGEIALGPYGNTEIGRATKLSPGQIGEALKDVLLESSVSTKSSAISIPMRSSMVSVFKMPKMKDKQLSQMIPIEARKYIPVPISEVTLDWFVVPGAEDDEEQKFLETMVVAIHNNILSDYSQIVKSANLNTSFFEVEMFSTARAVLDTAYNNPVMIIDVGAGATKVYVAERGIIRDSHIVNKGSQDITLNISRSLNVTVDYAEKMKRNYGGNEPKQDEEIRQIIDLIMDPIFSDARNFLLNFQKKYNKSISKVLLVGGGVLLEGLVEKAQEKLSVEVAHGNPFEKIETPAFLEDILKETGAAFTVAIGLAIRKLQELE